MNTVYLLGRFERKDKELAKFSKRLLMLYIENDEKELKELFKVYDTVRRISYLLLDSNYVQIPYKIELLSLVQMIENFNDLDDLINENSIFYKSIQYIDKLLEDILYVSPEMMLKTQVQFKILRKNFNEHPKQLYKKRRILMNCY